MRERGKIVNLVIGLSYTRHTARIHLATLLGSYTTMDEICAFTRTAVLIFSASDASSPLTWTRVTHLLG